MLFNDIAKLAEDRHQEWLKSRESKTYRVDMKKHIEEHLDALFDVAGVKAVLWEGYTPFFNDGDECLHSGIVVFTKKAVEDGPGFTTFYEGNIPEVHGGEEEQEWLEDLDKPQEMFWRGATDRAISPEMEATLDRIGSFVIEPLFKAAFGTNYVVTVIKNGDGYDWYDGENVDHD